MALLPTWAECGAAGDDGSVSNGENAPPVHHQFEVQALSCTELVEVLGETLGDLRRALRLKFDVPIAEQKVIYNHGCGDALVLSGDDSVLLTEKVGLLDSKVLALSRQVDPRYKMEKETAFFSALTACQFDEAREILESSGVVIDPNCVHKHTIGRSVNHTECPKSYSHPALTVAMMAGLENAGVAQWSSRVWPEKMQAWLSCESQVCALVKVLIEMEADVNATGDETEDCDSGGMPTRHGKTPLCAAVHRGSPTLVRMLLDAKADPNHTVRYDGGPTLTPESWLGFISFGSVSSMSDKDPRKKYHHDILDMLRAA